MQECVARIVTGSIPARAEESVTPNGGGGNT